MGRVFMVTVFVVGASVLVAFTLQNSAFTSPLQLDVWFAATRTRQPIPVPYLMWASFGVGFLVSGMWGMWRVMALARKTRKLEQELSRIERPTDGWSG